MYKRQLQDTWLFRGSIRDNIRYGKLDATDEEVEAAAKAGCAHHFIQTLPGGYDFEINEDASNISQGQRQLLTIARAILADRRMLILDEATSSVDTRTEERIQRAMDNLMAGRTSFVIAHRLSTICLLYTSRPVAGLGEADSLASSLEEMKGDFVDLMRRLHQARATSRTVPEGVTPAEARAVHVVWLMSRQGEAARPGSVAARMHTTPSALSQILKSLEEKGLLVRHRTRDDFRAVALELTDAGSAVAQETEPVSYTHLP